ncbi:MAG: Rieske (2Fe-2S) protein [bacterium]|nr:Rieske (2Fe-2S) protein [bacterium]
MYSNRSTEIDYDSVARLFYLGEYRRKLPVSMARMMENAYDWEHLPYIHSSTFASIEKIDEGSWGWRARVGLRDESSDRFSQSADAVGADDAGQVQDVELLVDRPRGYWATTVLKGVGTGVQIHTQATSLGDREIEIAVRFYLPSSYTLQLKILAALKVMLPFAAYRWIAAKAGLGSVSRDTTPAAAVFNVLESQYALLYDEDLGLMSERQTALDRRKQTPQSSAGGSEKSERRDTDERVPVGALADLEAGAGARVVVFGGRRYAVNRFRDEWIAYAADCPHQFGPLDQATIDDDGTIACPWHGYRFDVRSGASHDQKCPALPASPKIQIENGQLFLTAG